MRVLEKISPGFGKIIRCSGEKIFFISIILMAFQLSVSAQRSYTRVSSIDRQVSRIDSFFSKSQNTFHLTKWKKSGDAYKESWYYSIHNEQVQVFEIRYLVDSIEFNEIYYLDGNRLIFSEEYETVYTDLNDDKLKWARICHYENTMLMQIVTLGSQNNEFARINGGYDTQNRFRYRLSELRRQMFQ